MTNRTFVDITREPDGEFQRILRVASLKAQVSLVTAQRLIRGETAQLYAGAAYVWAVRSIEILIKEFMLLPIFLEQTGGDWKRAWRKVRRIFGSADWGEALRVVDQNYGPLEPMLTEDDQNVWDVWKTTVVARRGQIVHGESEATVEEAALVVQWAEQMSLQLKMRLIVAQKHPLHDIFVDALERAQKMMGAAEGQAPADG